MEVPAGDSVVRGAAGYCLLPSADCMRAIPVIVFAAAWCCPLFCASGLFAEGDSKQLPAAATRKIDFADEVLPLLQKNCFSCHGAEHQEGGLRLDIKKRALDGGDSGVEFVAGKSAESRLVRLLAGIDEDFGQMPPKGKGTLLTADEIGVVRAWIDQGANWPDEQQLASVASEHWSLKAVRRPAVPRIQTAEFRIQNSIDAFVRSKLIESGVVPSPPAERTALLRRLCLDLVGLPPSPEEIEAFTGDAHPDGTERLIDRLMASPHFGERWGRHWLDLARYADSDGYEKDRPRPFAYKYRDWVIGALNADMPFDEFTIEQIAGDMLPDPTLDQEVAAGLHRNTLHNTEGGADQEEDRNKKTVDRTNTLGAVWLGLTVGCAQCHSHKYDPLTQREYYSLFAFFNNIEEKDIENPTPKQEAALAAAKKAHEAKQAELEAAVKAFVAEKLPAAQATWEKTTADLPPEKLAEQKLPDNVAAALAKPAEERSQAEKRAITRYYRTIEPQLTKLDKAAKDHKAKPPQLPPEAKAQSVRELEQPRETHVHLRGDFLSPGDAVAAGTPAFLPPIGPCDGQATRLDLARWLVSPTNPLTARVTVNRIWHQLFGRGIVPTLDDFGKQGEKPSHAELLDWLASEFKGSGRYSGGSTRGVQGSAEGDRGQETGNSVGAWSLKRLIRGIVQSAAYQQSSAPRRDLMERDPENVLIARQARRRVEAEVIRDLSLASSGLLTTRIGGPSVRPPQPAEYATLTYANSAKWVESTGGDRYRRGLYTFFQRTSPYPMLMTFDSPDGNECAARRQTSNTPLQALTIWNDPAFFESARVLGRRIVAETPREENAALTAQFRTERAFLLTLSRRPSEAESSDVFALYSAARKLAEQDASGAEKLVGEPVATSDSMAEVAAWVSVARTLMNLDEFITRE
jgi:hypothetical protein